MTGREKAPAGGNHLLAVTRIERALSLHRQQVRVALSGDVETVAGRAAPGWPRVREGRAVERAGERREGGDVGDGVQRRRPPASG
jgi:hypothetical protein